MISIRSYIDRRIGIVISSLGLLLGIVLPSAFPVVAYAGSVTSRSITMSTAQKDATGVTYELKLTAESALDNGGGLVIEFCDNSPIIGLTCNHPSGLSTASVSADSGTATAIITNTGIEWADTAPVSAGTDLDITFSDMRNPTAVGTFYARITTYDAADMPDTGTFAGGTATGSTTYKDAGGIALSTAATIGVTAYVREAMTFCVSHAEPLKNCGSTSDPSLEIGESTGDGGTALDQTHVSTGVDYAQLSTNASEGAVVNLKTDSPCGGLLRFGTTNSCDIAAQDTAGDTVAEGQAKFGLMFGTVAGASDADPGTVIGTLAPTNSYDSSNYYLEYKNDDSAGVTSTYGSPIFNSASAPVGNTNIQMTFGASAAYDTPAGIYKANLTLIAVGTF